jgi:hypothetical protein
VLVDAGFLSLREWAFVADVSYGGLLVTRARGETLGPSVTRRLIASSRRPLTPALLHRAFLEPSRPRKKSSPTTGTGAKDGMRAPLEEAS